MVNNLFPTSLPFIFYLHIVFCTYALLHTQTYIETHTITYTETQLILFPSYFLCGNTPLPPLPFHLPLPPLPSQLTFPPAFLIYSVNSTTPPPKKTERLSLQSKVAACNILLHSIKHSPTPPPSQIIHNIPPPLSINFPCLHHFTPPPLNN